MEIKILEEREEKLFGRKEIIFETSYEGKTPSGEEVKQEICKKLGLSPDLTVVIKIDQAYGKGLSTVKVHSYAKKEIMERIVRKPKEVAKKPEAAKQAPEKKEEQKEKEPAKGEEQKEHPKAEEKKEEKKEHPKAEEKKDEPKKEKKAEENKE